MEWDRENGPSVGSGGASTRVITATGLAPGVYAIFAETNISDTNPNSGNMLDYNPTATAQCSIDEDSDVAFGSTVIGGSFFAGSGNVNMEITHTFSGTGTITMSCTSPTAWVAAGSSIIAIPLSSAAKVAVTS